MAEQEFTHLVFWTIFLCCYQQATAQWQTTTTSRPQTTASWTTSWPQTTTWPWTTSWPQTTTWPWTTWPTTITNKPTTTEAPEGTCPDGWFNADHLGCYYFDVENPDRQLSWVEAMDVCDNMGGYLAEIQTEEQAELVASIAMVEESLTGVGSWWIGLTDMGHEGRWMWHHSSTDSSYSDWLPGHPNTAPHNTDDCVYISESDLFLWRDVPCYQGVRAAPICQRDLDLGHSTTTDATTTPYTTTTTPYNTHVELRGGNGYSTGNVYAVNSNGFFGPVCDDSWGSSDARVVCRQLGFSDGTAKTGSYFGSVPSTFAMDDVACTGSEGVLQQCRYNTKDDCGSSEGAGVICYTTTGEPTTTAWPWTTTRYPWTTTTWWK